MSPRALSRLAAMPGLRAMLCAPATFACAAVFAACGGDGEVEGEIPSAKGNQWIGQLETIDQAIADGDCVTAQDTAVALAEDVSSESVQDLDTELRSTLVEATNNLVNLTREECVPTGTTGEAEVEPPPPAEPAPEPAPVEEATPEEEPPVDDEEDDAPGNSGSSSSGTGGGQGNASGQDDDSSGGVGSED